jgi:hypothetical protein
VSLTLLTTKKVDFIVEYLREYEAICKKALTSVSGAQMELFDEKNRGRKSRDRVPLTIQSSVRDPDPVRFQPFWKIRSNFLDPDPRSGSDPLKMFINF